MDEPLKYDWGGIIRDIEASGITLYKLHLMMNRTYGTLLHWRDKGGHPRHFDGQKLLAIHDEYVKKSTTEK